jgi:RNA polymerase sigma-54 factor
MISIEQSQKQQTKILPYQIYLLNFYFLNSLELDKRIKNEVEENPFLEQNADEEEKNIDNVGKEEEKNFQDYDEFMYEDVPDYKSEYQNYFDSR